MTPAEIDRFLADMHLGDLVRRCSGVSDVEALAAIARFEALQEDEDAGLGLEMLQ